jgi:hypothetical protein
LHPNKNNSLSLPSLKSLFGNSLNKLPISY